MKNFGLSADERIKSRKDFEQVFTYGKSLFSNDKKIKALFIIERNSVLPDVKMAAAVSHKAGNAVWRNRFKRLVKEAYRTNKFILKESAQNGRVSIKVVFSPYLLNKNKNSTIKLNEIAPAVLDIMNKIKSGI